MNTKKVWILILSAVVAGVVVSWTNANMFSFTWDINDRIEMRNDIEGNGWWFWKIRNINFKKWINGNMKWLTDDEKTALETMTDEEKKEFFEWKRSERQAEMETRKADRESHMWVVDKLINWEELSDDEEVILEEIKEKRAERQASVEERQVKDEEFRTIMDKVIAWEDITDEEKSIIDEHKVNSNRWMWGWRRWGWRWMHR